ncbi:dolichyl-diphosphooligosaccharide-protein glycotransferase [Sporobolomyces salmoneus]|uniref:dolichyl-diphosphooligosaccharide-protein glycotransferase n=1 Tax=Sporobolomyces salmoneus TaxID=183962 RepID=UPI00317FCFD7
MRLFSTLALALFSSGSSTLVSALSNVLAAVDAGVDPTHYSTFWRTLEDIGYAVDVQPYEAAGVKLRQLEDRVEHIIILGSSSKGLPAELSPQRLSSLVNAGTNVLLALLPTTSDVWRDYAREFEIDMADRGSQAVDFFNYDLESDDGSHTSLVLPLSNVPTPFVSSSTRTGPPVLYKGALHAIGRNPLLRPILIPPSTTFSAQPDSVLEDLKYYGSQSAVVSGFQARNNARITVVGSLDFFTDEAASSSIKTDKSLYPESGNSAFALDLARWTFGASGQRRVVAVRHGIAGGELSNPSTYRVKDELHYVLDVETSEKEAPEDLQLEFTMLDPHLRIPLENRQISAKIRRYEATFTIPDRHGVFTLRVDHRRHGWANIETTTVVSVTPPRHDEYERFIRGAAPYYGGALSVSIGLLAFVFFWIVQS